MTDTFPAAGFGSIHFGNVDLGDARVNRRLATLADLLVASGAESLPDKFADPADYRAFNRLVGRPEATHEAVTAPHRAHTRNRMRAHTGAVLVLHDTTELDYSGRALPRMGPIGNGHGTGWECHNSLAVDAGSGAVLGLAAQILHRRPPTRSNRGETKAQRRQRQDRESRLWVTGLEAVGPAPDGRHWVHVSDRGSDTFEYLSALVTGGHRFVVRSRHDRVRSDEATLHAHLRALSAVSAWSGEVRCGPHGGSTRTADLSAAGVRVELPDPSGSAPALGVWALRVWEPNPPDGVDPVEWFLLTDRALDTAAGLREVAGWYCQRPIIEEYHKALKSGCGVEELGHRTPETYLFSAPVVAQGEVGAGCRTIATFG
ncbi:Transposase for transposon Tn5 [Gemmata obscuriglobus]|nr:IS4 family transposase [Gemmata obscuriglobus]QEG31025.1 Transposase for transposon Tn5 [Gemmata obscuriglobus]VTS10360.1 transposase family protein : Transposase IS4 family protein OS=Ktedonobacter racemifer DSM 44963 GN=Krac_0604 PE=4 SV=1: Tnp_DNA_bind [Gemmata obscuriglobus UQM 2246]